MKNELTDLQMVNIGAIMHCNVKFAELYADIIKLARKAGFEDDLVEILEKHEMANILKVLEFAMDTMGEDFINQLKEAGQREANLPE